MIQQTNFSTLLSFKQNQALVKNHHLDKINFKFQINQGYVHHTAYRDMKATKCLSQITIMIYFLTLSVIGVGMRRSRGESTTAPSLQLPERDRLD